MTLNFSQTMAWRHTFKAVGRRAGISDKILDDICGHNLELLSFAPRVLAAARATPKQSLEKSALITACVVG